VRDSRASRTGADDAQLGFRVPTHLISSYARPGFVDHCLEHVGLRGLPEFIAF
jgi:hypothetical protein